MAESSQLLDRRTTKTRSVIFGGLRSKGHGNVAKALGIGESTFSEWLDKNGDRVAAMLTATGLKVVPVDALCRTPRHMKSLMYFAQLGMTVDPDDVPADESPALDWEDE